MSLIIDDHTASNLLLALRLVKTVFKGQRESRHGRLKFWLSELVVKLRSALSRILAAIAETTHEAEVWMTEAFRHRGGSYFLQGWNAEAMPTVQIQQYLGGRANAKK